MSADAGRAKAVFLEALDLPGGAQRQAHLDVACGGDEALRREVEELLRHEQDLGSFLEARPSGATTCDAAPAAGVGAAVGPYKLLEQIGEGGFGVVYMAEQQEPIRRKVAVKVLKPGMDTRQVIARFEAERQALALMDHPNISKVLDAGSTASGRPYFVMELVKGVAVTKFCDDNRLTLRERLELFVSVCQAVQHAHQKGIIHRDLKPANVLVTLHDGTPVVKVIDFGVAKATEQQLTAKTLFTGFAQMIGTPLYMSPEQAGLSGLDIDTRSDVYSLGALLYELLTGTTPFDGARLLRAGYDEMRRIIREEEPPRPSTRFSTLGGAAATLSTQRQSDPKRLSQLFRGELDWIVMKALEKDRNRRYESASAFAADVQHYLNDEAVAACPPSAWYRCRKFTRRHKTGLALAGLVLLFTASLGVGTGWVVSDRTARQARAASELALVMDRADLFLEQGKHAEAAAAFGAAERLAAQAPPDPARGARLAVLKARLDADTRDRQFVARFEEIRLAVQSRVQVQENRFALTEEASYAEIHNALAEFGIDIGAMMPAQVGALLEGRPEPIRRNLIAALDECLMSPKADKQTQQRLFDILKVADDDSWRQQVRQARANRDAGAPEQDAGALEQLAREANVEKQPPSFLLLTAYHLPARMWSTRLELLRRVQNAYPADLWANLELASALQENGRPAEAVRYYTAALALRPDNPGIYLNRGNALRDAGELDAAIADYQRCLTLAPQYAAAHLSFGTALSAKGQVDKAIEEYRAALGINKDYAEVHVSLGTALYNKGRLDGALAEYREAVRLRDDLPEAHYGLGLGLFDKNQVDEAIAEYQKAIAAKANYDEPHIGLGRALFEKGLVDDAIAEYEKAIRIKKDRAAAHYGLGIALRAKKKVDAAIAEYHEAIRLKNDFAQAHYSLGIALRSKGLVDEAIAAYREAIRINPDYAEAHYNLGNTLFFKERIDDAVAAYRAATRIREEYAEAHYNLGQALLQQGEFSKALMELRRGQELGVGKPGWKDASGQAVRQCQRLVQLDGRLSEFIDGKKAADTAEWLALGELCSLKRLNRAAVRFYAEAFAAEPKLENDLGARHRYNAARAAALAGCRAGKDAANLDDKECAGLRRQALDWLRADLEAWGRLLDREPDKVRSSAAVGAALGHWTADSSFAGVRGPEALLKLPAAERQAWQALWGDVACTLAQAQQQKTAGTKADAK